MGWRRIGDKPLCEPKMALFTDAHMQHSASMSKGKINASVKLVKTMTFMTRNDNDDNKVI